MPWHIQFGSKTEEKALEWFVSQKRYTLLKRNFKTRFGEIDLIFEEEVLTSSPARIELVFVEVRARSNGAQVTGVDSITPKKLHRIRRTAEAFLKNYQGPAKTLRLDCLIWDEAQWTHLKNCT